MTRPLITHISGVAQAHQARLVARSLILATAVAVGTLLIIEACRSHTAAAPANLTGIVVNHFGDVGHVGPPCREADPRPTWAPSDPSNDKNELVCLKFADVVVRDSHGDDHWIHSVAVYDSCPIGAHYPACAGQTSPAERSGAAAAGRTALLGFHTRQGVAAS